ncbi:shikimate kinase [Vallitalea pronyensis]|uniref:Shikimate kinase n=1 Tax=Vallitalea pronyensis TaxID=1348613 RepID=A0A8J8MH11_9FIRM|nr:shikimate kinase [Vallitalea pronyensis]QUI21168.1 shikimate kinase [Vallitalea pronyensis]
MKNIVLIGMPGAGKSTIGVVLAKTLGMDFIDSDLIIQHRENRLLQDLIDEVGMDKFLDIERKSIKSIQNEGAVIATGGSVVFREDAMAHLKQNGIMVYLHVPYEEIKRRVQNITTRGIAKKKGYSLRDVFEERSPLYEKYHDVKVNWQEQSVEEIIDAIIHAIPQIKLKK